MNTCLHVTCGPYHLLFDIARVMEVGDVPATGALASHRYWREKNLPVINLRERLGLAAQGVRQQLVVDEATTGESTLAMVDVDRIVGIREFGDEDRVEVPPLHDALEDLVDGGWLDRDSGTCLLHIRLPIAAEHTIHEPTVSTLTGDPVP